MFEFISESVMKWKIFLYPVLKKYSENRFTVTIAVTTVFWYYFKNTYFVPSERNILNVIGKGLVMYR